MVIMSAVVLRGDARSLPLPDGSVDLIVTSPPYWSLRDYRDGGESLAGQIGSEETPQQFVDALLSCTREWVRVLRPTGSIFVNLGDSYYSAKGNPGPNGADDKQRARRGWERPTDRSGLGFPRKSLIGLPWRYAIGCVDELGLTLRAEIIWAKSNGMPESANDRVRRAHEQIFHLTRQPVYYSAVDEIREPHAAWTVKAYGYERGGYQRRVNGDRKDAGGFMKAPEINPLGKLPSSVWEINSQPLKVPDWIDVDHFAAFPMEIPRRIIQGWAPSGICMECDEGRRPQVLREIGPDAQGRVGTLHGGDRARLGHATERKMLDGLSLRTITGYACGCPDASAPTRPAVVLDPFGGTGTTSLVAAMLGRTGISVDRSADYCRLARWRTTDPAERARALGVPKPPPVIPGQLDLLTGEAS